MIHITEFDLDVFFHQVVSICTGSMKVLRPSRQVITFSTTLTLIQQAVTHRWKEEAARREAFFGVCGMDPPSVPIDI